MALDRRYLWLIFSALLALLLLYLQEIYAQPPTAVPVQIPHFSHPGGYYAEAIQLELQTTDPAATVLFTRDGRVPTPETAMRYAAPIPLSDSQPGANVIRARLHWPDGRLGSVASASYFVGLPADMPYLSLIVDPVDLWDPERGLVTNPLERGIECERPVDVTFIDTDGRDTFHISAGLRIHGGFTRTYDKKSWRLYFREIYGARRLHYPLFDETTESFDRLVIHGGGQDSPNFGAQWALMRSQLVARLALEAGGYATRSRAALLFLNGRPWGVYQIRERIDADFLADNFGLGAADLLDTPHLTEMETVAAGDRQHWDHLIRFLETHDLADPANYAYVQSQVDLNNFIDYTILQIYSANYDWPQHNVNQFRPRVQGGRWQWLFWDNDFGFGLDADSQVDLDMINQALKLDRANRTTRHDTLLLRKLLQNSEFRLHFFGRAADLLNTNLAPESVLRHIDALASELEPGIAYEVGRWASTTDWRANVQIMRDFARQRPHFVRQHIVAQFGLGGTAQFTFNPPVSGGGTIAVNGIEIATLPWQGIYFKGTAVRVTAVPQPGYRFTGWQETDAITESLPDQTIAVADSRSFTPRFVAIGDDAPGPGDVVISQYGAHDAGDLKGDWFELRVMRPGGVDLRGWRLTDNDSKSATDEGSLILPQHPALARVPQDTIILIVTTTAAANQAQFPEDDLDSRDGRMLLHAGNGLLDTTTDPWFNFGANDNLALLAPGPTAAFSDDQGIAFVAIGEGHTPAAFGVLADGVFSATPDP